MQEVTSRQAPSAPAAHVVAVYQHGRGRAGELASANHFCLGRLDLCERVERTKVRLMKCDNFRQYGTKLIFSPSFPAPALKIKASQTHFEDSTRSFVSEYITRIHLFRAIRS